MKALLSLAFAFFCWSELIASVSGLECYVCNSQEGNRDKCVKTTVQCQQGQDTCATRMWYTTPPYWTPFGDRVVIIWKSCAVMADCLAMKANISSQCSRQWYIDWSCAECCQGDMCNYYVTMASDRFTPNMMLFGTLLVLTLSSHLTFFRR